MKRLYLITGACDIRKHLGADPGQRGAMVRGLILPWGNPGRLSDCHVRERGRCDLESLRMLFVNTKSYQLYVIHTAGIVDISDRIYQKLYEVNVKGRGMLKLCQEYQVKRLVYVSSVHAIAAGENNRVLVEVDQFSPDTVKGGYAKTKAEATAAVLNAARQGLDAVVVHPSGIWAPMTPAETIWCSWCGTIYRVSSRPVCAEAMTLWMCAMADGCLRAMGPERGVLYSLQPPL